MVRQSTRLSDDREIYNLMALEGTLEDFSLADIFQLIGIQRKTGVLTLKSTEETVTVTFHNGMVIGADSHPRKLEDRIGKVLVKTGLITQGELNEALDFQQKTLQKIGFILINHNYISKEQLKEALQIQVTQMIYRLFRWNSGEYYFDQKAKVDPNSDESIAPMSAESILMEGIHMIDEWPVIQKRIPSVQMVFKPVVSPEEIVFGEGEDSEIEFESESERIRMSREEEEVYRLVDGSRTVGDIVESSRFGEFHTYKALYELLERMIVEPLPYTPKTTLEPTFVLPVRQEESRDYSRLLYPGVAVIILVFFLLNVSQPMKLLTEDFLAEQELNALNVRIDHLRFNRIDSAILLYYYANSVLPTDIEELVDRHYIEGVDIVDPWNRAYEYDVRGDSYFLTGHTPDGRVNQATEIRRQVTRVVTESANVGISGATVRFENMN